MRTFPPCVLESVTVIPFTARLNVFCEETLTTVGSSSDELDLACVELEEPTSLDDDPCIAKELLDTTLDELSFSEELEGGDTELEDSTLLEEYFSEELDATTELLLDSSLLLKMTSEEELLAGACDELDSTDDDETEDAAFHSMSSSGYFSPCFQAT